MEWNVVPITAWPGPNTSRRRQHPFREVKKREGITGTYNYTSSGVNWPDTVDLLARELKHLRAKNVLLQMAVTREDIRQDGWIRANARPLHPGVILTFDTPKGTASLPCDTFTNWQANVRSIAIALEDLRRIDRYGVSKNGEQYRGFYQLPAGREAMVSRGQELIREHGGEVAALKATHPDRGGDREEFEAVVAARAQ